MIPEGWTEMPLKAVVKLGSGDGRPKDIKSEPAGEHTCPVYGGNGILGYSSAHNSAADDIIIGRVGEYCGITRFVRGPKWITDNALFAKSVIAGVDREFLALKLRHFDVSKLRSKGGQPLVSQEPIYAQIFAFPPLEEQGSIVRAITTWDRAIETMEALISNARAQKKALMQSLLTGKHRLSGFSGEWTEKTLDTVFQFLKGQGLSKDSVTEEGVFPCILYGELYTRYPEVIGDVVGRTNANDGALSLAGDVLIPASTTTTGIDLANATALLQSDVRLSGDINILRPKDAKQSAPFFAYLLTHIKRLEIASRAQGSTVVHLYGSALQPLVVRIPESEEQHAIAAIVMDADEQISELETQLNALRQEKSALMQQLLTGKRRVKVSEKEATHA